MTETWKLDSNFYILYTESKDIMNRVKRYYGEFSLMATYYHPDGKLKALQYKVPIQRKRVAQRLSRIK
ncbi:MAG: hypothetical protein LPK26_04665 [Bacillaceae bacterium]|nr:hypothetical protein [Bacillaceae bacterium]